MVLNILPFELVSSPAISSFCRANNSIIENTFLAEKFIIDDLSFNVGDIIKNASIQTDIIPFDETTPRIYYVTNFDRVFNICIDDGINRFKKIYQEIDNFDKAKFTPFLMEFGKLKILPRLSFYPDGVKARFVFNDKEFAVEYDLEADDGSENLLFISTFINDKLHVKDGHISDLAVVLESFNGSIS
jgi:hypothetical protein